MKNRNSLRFFSILISSACLMVITLTLLVSQNLDRLINYWSQGIHVNVYLSENLSAEDQMKVEDQIVKLKGIASFEIISQAHAIELLEKQLSGVAASLGSDTELLKMIPTTYSLGMDPKLTVDQKIIEAQKLSKIISAWPEVQDVSYGQEWLQNYAGFTKVAKYILNFLSILVAFSSVFIISNSIRAHVESKRYEIEILELVGATKKMIQSPFLKEGAAIGAMAGTLGILFSFVLFFVLKERILKGSLFSDIQGQLQFLNLFWILSVILLSASIGAFASYLCVRKINTGWAASQR